MEVLQVYIHGITPHIYFNDITVGLYVLLYFIIFMAYYHLFLDSSSLPYYVISNVSVIWLVLAFPGTIINFIHGQNGFFTANIVGRRPFILEKRPVLAGIFFGFLSYKPQFGILIPFALIAGKYWKTIFSAFLTSIFLIILSLLIVSARNMVNIFK